MIDDGILFLLCVVIGISAWYKCFALMAATAVARYQKASAMGRSNNTKYVEEYDLTETGVLAERLKSICAKKKEADDKTREAFTK